MSEELNKIEELVGRLKAYLNTRLSQLKLSTAEKNSKRFNCPDRGVAGSPGAFLIPYHRLHRISIVNRQLAQ